MFFGRLAIVGAFAMLWCAASPPVYRVPTLTGLSPQDLALVNDLNDGFNDGAVGEGGGMPPSFRAFLKLSKHLPAATWIAWLADPNPRYRAWAALYVIHFLPNERRHVLPLLHDRTLVSTQFGCIGSAEPMARLVLLLAEWEGAHDIFVAAPSEPAADPDARAQALLHLGPDDAAVVRAGTANLLDEANRTGSRPSPFDGQVPVAVAIYALHHARVRNVTALVKPFAARYPAEVAYALATSGDDDARVQLLAMAQRTLSSNSEQREVKAAYVAISPPDDALAKQLFTRYRSDRDFAYALSDMGTDAAIPWIDHLDDLLRLGAIETYTGEIDKPTAAQMQWMRTMLTHQNSIFVHLAIDVLAKAPTPEDTEAFRALLSSDSQEIRKAADAALRKPTTQVVRRGFLRHFEDEPSAP
jgi:hypothetical protein